MRVQSCFGFNNRYYIANVVNQHLLCSLAWDKLEWHYNRYSWVLLNVLSRDLGITRILFTHGANY